MYTNNTRGSALVLVLIASVFLIILTAGAYQYFKMNSNTQIWARDRIQAKLSAEAGINLATHMLMAGASLPADSLPEDILGTEISFFDLPGDIGSVYASVDPSNSNNKVTSANAYLIRCIASVPGLTMDTYGMQSIVMPENLARFSVFMNNPSTSGYYGDGYRFDGPFYANGPVRVISTSPSSENDPFFYSFRLTSGYYVSQGNTPITTPSTGNLEMQPYNRLLMGPPFFDLNVDPIPFGEDELDWEGVRSAAQTNGLYFPAGSITDSTRLALKGDTLLIKAAPGAVVQEYYLGDLENPVVWIENGTDECFFLRSSQLQGLNIPLTIGCRGDVYMSGELSYENTDLQDPDNEQILGVMTVNGDLVIADDPGDQFEWGSQSFWVDTKDGFNYYAVIVALEGDLYASNYHYPPGPQEFRLNGGYMIQEEGYTSSSFGGGSGFDIGVYFDPRLLYMHPPFFPTTANWNTTMWADKPDMTVNDVANGTHPEY